MTKVKNIIGTADNECKCGSWLDHWENFSGYSAVMCSENSCFNSDLEGAHVQKISLFDDSWYIVPLCKKHNKSKEILNVGTTILVSANKNKTCEKE